MLNRTAINYMLHSQKLTGLMLHYRHFNLNIPLHLEQLIIMTIIKTLTTTS